MSRMRIVLGAVAVVLTAAGIAAPALADTDTAWVKGERAPRVEQAQPKWPGDPYAGKCVYWLKGDTQLRECDR